MKLPSIPRGGAAALGLALCACPPALAQTLNDPSLLVQTVASTLSLPTSFAFVSPDRILVLEKNTGRVRVVSPATGLLAQDALDVSVSNNSERGLLGIAVNTENPPKVFLYYTEADFDQGPPLGNRIYSYTWNPQSERLESPILIRDLPVLPGANHNGGVLVLGPTGVVPGVGDGSALYAVIGDLNHGGHLQNVSGGPPADDTSVIVRLQQDGVRANPPVLFPYCSNNPAQSCLSASQCGGATCTFAALPYFAYGVRNSFGLAFDPVTGELWDTENGPASFDEINRIVPGMNSGWVRVMGPAPVGGVPNLVSLPGSVYRDPELSFLDTIGITGIVFPFGSSLGATYDDLALVGDYNTGRLWGIPLQVDRLSFELGALIGLGDKVVDLGEELPLVLGSGFGGIIDLEVGPDGHLYLTSIGTGRLFRIVPREVPVPALPSRWLGALFASALSCAGAVAIAGRASRSRDPKR